MTVRQKATWLGLQYNANVTRASSFVTGASIKLSVLQQAAFWYILHDPDLSWSSSALSDVTHKEDGILANPCIADTDWEQLALCCESL